MKKVLCAAAIAAIVAPVVNANAVTIYNKDNFKYSVNGDWEIQLRQDVGEDQDVDLVFDDLEIKNRAEYDLGNNMTAFGQVDFGFKKAANNSNGGDRGHLEEAYLGISVGSTSLLFGKTDGAADSFGVADAKVNPVADDVFDAFGATGGDDLVKIQTKIGDMVTIVADHELAADSSSTDNNGKFYSIYAEADVAGFTFGAAFQNFDPKGEEMESDGYNMFGVSLAYDAGFVSVGADYSIQEDTDVDPERTIMNVVLSAPVGEYIAVTAGYVVLDSDDDAEETKGWYANFNYSLPMQDNVSFFAEVEDSDADNTDMGFLVGMKLTF